MVDEYSKLKILKCPECGKKHIDKLKWQPRIIHQCVYCDTVFETDKACVGVDSLDE